MGLLHTTAVGIKSAGGYKGSVTDAVTDARPLLEAWADWVQALSFTPEHAYASPYEIADLIREAAAEAKR